MKLYYSKGACSLSVRMLMHELSIPSEFERVDLATKKTEQGADFSSINPKGMVPVLELDNQDILTENTAIHQYLLDQKNPHFPGDFSHYRVLEWLSYIGTDLHKGVFSALFNTALPDDLKETVFKPSLKKKLNFVNASLEQRPYLLGASPTSPDFYLFAVLRWAPHFKVSLEEWSNIARFRDALYQRDSVRQSLLEEGLK